MTPLTIGELIERLRELPPNETLVAEGYDGSCLSVVGVVAMPFGVVLRTDAGSSVERLMDIREPVA